VIVDAQKGYVLTANHVVAQASLLQIKTKDGRKFAAMLVGRDAPTDVALLIATGHVERGRIGVVLEDLDAPAGGHLEGARVKEVSPAPRPSARVSARATSS
jgi:S1-C subfamily serine protease